ncbi:MAG: hypothetical protein EOP11_12770, partial [Proteobacteria bacterium]
MTNPSPEPGAAKALRAFLEKPLITGASVSADQSSLSPGKKLCRRYHPQGDVRTIAFGGKRSTEILSRVKPADFDGRTIVIALDLFFWDSALPDPIEAIRALDGLLSYVRAQDIPVVLGEIPELLPGFQPGRARLNQAVAQAKETYPRCAVMPFEKMLRSVLTQGYLEIKGRRHGLFELVPDGLHLASFAGDYLS